MLASLADKSLLRLDASGRYDIHELLRQFASDKLAEAGETSTVAQKHLEYHAKLAEAGEAHAYGREQAAWYDRQEMEMDNLRAALAWSLSSANIELGLRMAAALRWVWEMRGHSAEGTGWFEKLLAVSQGVSPSVRVKALHRACEMTGMANRTIPQTRLWAEEAVQLSRALNDRWNMAWSLSAFCFSISDATDLNQIAAMQDESLALFRELDDPLGLSHALRRRAIVASNQGDYAYGQTLIEEALSRDRAAQDKNATAWELLLLGAILWHRHHNPDQVVALYQESLALFREIQDIQGTVRPLVALSNIERSQGNDGRAGALYGEALLIDHRLGVYCEADRWAIAGMAGVAVAQRKPERAARLLGAARAALTSDDYNFIVSMDTLDEDVATVRAQLDDLDFDQLWSEGQAMTLEQAIIYALQAETPPTETRSIPNRGLPNLLTERELEILSLVADEGLNNAEIAERLFLSISTIRWYLKQIYGKLDVHNRTKAVLRARELNLLT
jgi:DNA-binding CsgD family transcriptional regulator